MASTRPTISITLRNWAPVVSWAALIFVFSTEQFSGTHTGGIVEAALRQVFPSLALTEVERIHALVRKLGHLSEYFILALLLMRALRAEMAAQSTLQPILLSILLTILYAGSDEFHQSFVPNRSASVADVMIDAAGGICGTLLSHLRNRRPKAPGNSP